MSLVNVGTVKRPSYVPPELCKVLPSQKANKPLSREQQRKLAKALKQYRQDTISTIGESAKALTIGTKDSQGLVSKKPLHVISPLTDLTRTSLG